MEFEDGTTIEIRKLRGGGALFEVWPAPEVKAVVEAWCRETGGLPSEWLCAVLSEALEAGEE